MALPFETRGSRLIVVDNNGKAIGWITTHGTPRVWANNVFLGEYQNFQSAALALEQALTPNPPDPESPDEFRVPDDGDEIIDASGAVWTIETGTNSVLRNGQWFNGGWAQELLYLDGEVWHKGFGTGHWYRWDGQTWEDNGIGDPTNPPLSAAWFTVPDDGASMVDLDGNTWSLGTQIGSGYDILKNGVVYGGWAARLKLDDDFITIWHENPSGLGWIKEDPDHLPSFWENPTSDPETGIPPPPGGNGVTTGSISAGSNILTVADTTAWTDALIAANLAYAIVEVGHEAGGGVFGTRGVGGQWPPTVYANSSARQAALGSHSNLEHVGQLDTGDVWAKSGGVWVNRADGALDSSNYTLSKIHPLALVGRVVSVVRGAGQLILDVSASLSTTNANVYLDGTRIIQAAVNALTTGSNPNDPGNTSSADIEGINGPFDWDNITLSTVNLNTLFPTYSSVATSSIVQFNGKRYAKLTQDTTISFQVHAPKGTSGAYFEFVNCTGILVDKVRLTGSSRNAGGYTGLHQFSATANPNWGFMPAVIQDAFDSGRGSMSFALCEGCTVRNYTVSETTSPGFTLFCSHMHFKSSIHNRTDPPPDYLWHWQHMNGADNWIVDCTSSSDHLHGGFELFQCSGGGIVRPNSRNGTLSCNDCGSGYMIGVDQANPTAGGGQMRFTLNSMVGSDSMPGSVFISWFSPIIDINTSQNQTESLIGGTYPSGYKGIVQGLQIVMEDYMNPGNDTILGIKVRDNNADMRLIGNVYQGRNYVSGSRTQGSVGIQSSGLNCFIQGNVVSGASLQGGQGHNIWASRGIDGGGNIVNSPNEKQIF